MKRKRKGYDQTAFWVVVRDEQTAEMLEKHSFPTRGQALMQMQTEDYARRWGKAVAVEIEAHPVRAKV